MGAALLEVESRVKNTLYQQPGPSQTPEGKLFVPEAERSHVLEWGHSSRLACHPGAARTLALVQQRFWWPTMREDTRQFVNACDSCARSKTSNKPPAGFLRPLPIPRRPWSHIALDFVMGLPDSEGNTCVLTVVDRFSQAAHFNPLSGLPTAKETAELLIMHVFRLHGLPKDITSDRGSQFTARFWSAFCKLIAATPSLSSGYHPQTNGQEPTRI